MSFALVQDIAAASGSDGAALVSDIQAGFDALESELDVQGSLATGFVPYTQLSEADKRALVDRINALAEPLSQLTATILR